MARLLDGGDSFVDVGLCRLLAHQAQRALGMAVGMVADAMTFRDLAFDELRQAFGIAADEEEGRSHAFLRERVQHGRRRRGGAVVEGQHDLMVLERQRARIALQTERQRLAADADFAARAERVGSAGGTRRASRRENQRAEQDEDGTRNMCHERFSGLNSRLILGPRGLCSP